jgi:hypothetical protein
MKKFLLLILPVLLVIACNDNKKLKGLTSKDDDGGWTSAIKNKYLKKCADEGITKDICSCLLNKVAKKYTVEEADELGEEIGKKLAKECLSGDDGGDDEDDNGLGKKKKVKDDDYDEPSGWSKTDRNTFLSQCENALTGTNGFSNAKATQYCDCALGKLEKKYASLAEGNAKGGETAGTKAMQQCTNEIANGNDDEEDN